VRNEGKSGTSEVAININFGDKKMEEFIGVK